MLRHERTPIKHHESSITLPYGPNRKEKCKSFCRKTIAFMCTQVGVGGLIVVYALAGALLFQKIEAPKSAYKSIKPPTQKYNYTHQVSLMRLHYAKELWITATKYNVFNETAWKAEINETIKTFQDNLTVMMKHGYDKRTMDEIWSFPATLMFCLSVFSMIGYGKLVPKTDWGKVTTIIYATFGIPLYILYFLNIGKELAKTFRWVYRRIHDCSQDPLDDQKEIKKKIIVPSTACIWVLFSYILLGSLMFTYLDDWEFLNSMYFCVTSLCKIGMGDFVPETSTNATLPAILKSEKNTKLIINFVYILFGMGLVAMCYELMREDIRDKIKEVKEDMTLCLEDMRLRLAACCGANDKNIEIQ